MFGLAAAVALAPGCSGQFLSQVLGNDGGVVSPPGGGPSIASFTANPSSVTSGGSSALSWQVTGATSVSLTPGVGDVTHQSTQTVQPLQTTTYTLIAVNAAGSDTKTVTVTVGTTPPVTDGGTGDDFPSTAPWYQDVSQVTPDPASDTMISALVAAGGFAGHDSGLEINFDMAVLHADSAVARVTFQHADLPDYDFGCDLAPFPLPAGGNVEGNPNYQCSGEADGADCHLLVYQGRRLYEGYQGDLENGVLSLSCEAVWDLDQDYWQNITPYSRGDGCTSADAAGFPVATLTTTGAELAAGVIPHALRLILKNERMRGDVYTHPATHAGSPSGSSALPPYGAHLRLKADFDETRLGTPVHPQAAHAVVVALQKYGMFIADGGSIPMTFDQTAATQIDAWDVLAIQAGDFEVMPLETLVGPPNWKTCPDTRVRVTN